MILRWKQILNIIQQKPKKAAPLPEQPLLEKEKDENHLFLYVIFNYTTIVPRCSQNNRKVLTPCVYSILITKQTVNLSILKKNSITGYIILNPNWSDTNVSPSPG